MSLYLQSTNSYFMVYFNWVVLAYKHFYLQTTVWGPLDPTALSTSSQKVIIGIQPCMPFIPHALVFGVHWTLMEVEVWVIFYSSMKVNGANITPQQHQCSWLCSKTIFHERWDTCCQYKLIAQSLYQWIEGKDFTKSKQLVYRCHIKNNKLLQSVWQAKQCKPAWNVQLSPGATCTASPWTPT